MEECAANFLARFTSEICPHAATTSMPFKRPSIFRVAWSGAEIGRVGWALTLTARGPCERPLPAARECSFWRARSISRPLSTAPRLEGFRSISAVPR